MNNIQMNNAVAAKVNNIVTLNHSQAYIGAKATFLQEPSASAPSTRNTRKESELLANELKNNLGEFISLNKLWSPDYYREHYIGAVKVQVKGETGFCLLDKKGINTRFCFRDKKPDYELYLRVTSSEENKKAFFLSNHLSSICLYNIEERTYYIFLDEKKEVCITSCYGCSENAERMTSEQVKAINRGLTFKREEYERRLKAYLKRNGTSKLDFWTYWADR